MDYCLSHLIPVEFSSSQTLLLSGEIPCGVVERDVVPECSDQPEDDGGSHAWRGSAGPEESDPRSAVRSLPVLHEQQPPQRHLSVNESHYRHSTCVFISAFWSQRCVCFTNSCIFPPSSHYLQCCVVQMWQFLSFQWLCKDERFRRSVLSVMVPLCFVMCLCHMGVVWSFAKKCVLHWL